MGHLPIVSPDTIGEMIDTGYISVRGDLKESIVKTTADIFSDVLATRPGDLVFPWITDADRMRNGFRYVFKVSGPPIFVPGEQYPVKVPLANEGIEYAGILRESDALDLWDTRLLWNIIGKKSLGRGRSITHQTPYEDTQLTSLLESKAGLAKPVRLGQTTYANAMPIAITLNESRHYGESLSYLDAVEPQNRLMSLRLVSLPWRRQKVFSVEKVLEAWLMENIDKEACGQVRDILGLEDVSMIKWFGNYLPYGVQGSNIDCLSLCELDGRLTMFVIELKRDKLNSGDLAATVHQVEDYCRFVDDALLAYDVEAATKPVIICHGLTRGSLYENQSRSDLKLIRYEIEQSGGVVFADVDLSATGGLF